MLDSDKLIESPLITIIVAVYNGAETLQRCIDSVAGQTHPNKELIIMDGGSTDGTLNIIKANLQKITYWESKPDKGIYDAWNKALDYARGEWICFLGADDFLWENNVLERLEPHLIRAYPPSRVLYGRIAVVSRGKTIEIRHEPWNQKGFCNKMNVSHSGTMQHHSLFELHGKFDISFKVAGDYDLLLRELKNNSAYFVEDIITAGIEIGGLSGTMESPTLTFKEHRKARKNNGINHLSILIEWHLFLRSILFFISKLFGNNIANKLADLYRKCIGKPPFFHSLKPGKTNISGHEFVLKNN